MTVVLISADLTVLARVEGAAQTADQSIRAFASVSQALAESDWDDCNRVIVDLGAVSEPSAELESLMPALQQVPGGRPRVIAFGPHVHADKLAAAKTAGCDDVLSRGEFFARVSAIMQG